MAQIAVSVPTNHPAIPWFRFAKGLAEYRQGQFERAAEWLEKVTVLKGDPYRNVQAHMVLAMAQQQLRKTNEARLALAEGLELAETRFAKPGKGNLDEQWNDWIIAHALMREAGALLDDPFKPNEQVK